MEPRSVGVVGAGVMGRGVAEDLARAGHAVLLVDVDEAILERARGEIRRSLRLGRLLGAPAPREGAEAVLARIETTTRVGELARADFVVENATEKWAVKREVYGRLREVVADDVVLAANTSALSITRLASLVPRPERVLGIHFMNPVPLKKTVEVVRGHHTSRATLAAAQALLGSLGKQAVVVNDWPGFVSNRVLMLTVNEAIGLVQDGVAAPAEIDRLFRECFGHAMGPLETGDLIGLDTILYSIEVLYESFNDPKYRPAPLLRKMVDAGLLGRKSGRGFHAYEAGERRAAGEVAGIGGRGR